MRSDRQRDIEAANRRRARNLPIAVESLEGRALLSSGLPATPIYGPPTPTPTPTPTNPMPTPTPTPTPVIVTPTPTPTPVVVTPTPTPVVAAPIPTPRHTPAPLVTPVQPAPAPPPVDMSPGMARLLARHTHQTLGIATKRPHFYEDYTGPRWAELDAVRATAFVSSSTNMLTLTGTNAGRINRAPATYVWGIDRNGNLPPGPFTNRPNVKFDAVVVVKLDSSLTPTTQVVDLASGVTTTLPAGSASIHGREVMVAVPLSSLPSTGLAPSQYHFNYWPEDGGPPISPSVASFLPEFTTEQVGTTQ